MSPLSLTPDLIIMFTPTGMIPTKSALVLTDVAPFSLVAGVPATFKKTLEPKTFPELPTGAP
jgi:hypothetical protein